MNSVRHPHSPKSGASGRQSASGDAPRTSSRAARAARTLALLTVGGTATAVAGPAPAVAAACTGADRTVRSQGPSRAEAAVRCLVNLRRRDAGLRPVRFSAGAHEAAERHTKDMVRRRYFSHTAPDGSTVADRATRAGLRWRRVGENIALGQRTPRAVVRTWMRTPEHRHNILSPAFTRLGVGTTPRSPTGGRTPTWTQVFVRPAR